LIVLSVGELRIENFPPLILATDLGLLLDIDLGLLLAIDLGSSVNSVHSDSKLPSLTKFLFTRLLCRLH